jgi:small subunit ribosomal protein S8
LSGVNDLISDMLTRIRNAVAVKSSSLSMPTSKARVSLATILKQEGYIRTFEVRPSKPQGVLRIQLLYREGGESAIRGLKRISKPGLRVYVGKGEIPRVYGGIGTAILSTSSGVMTGREAWHGGVGGELLCYVW